MPSTAASKARGAARHHGHHSAGGDAFREVNLFPMRSWRHLNGNALLEAFHKAQRNYPIREIWDPSLKLPAKLLDYVCAVTADFTPQIRQEAVLLLKRYVHATCGQGESKHARPHLQVVALTCAHLAIKHWQHKGIPEQKMHWLSRNAYTQRDFIQAEGSLLGVLGCCVYWEGVLLAEWQALLLFLVGNLLTDSTDSSAIAGVCEHVSDVLTFHDELMASYRPSELAAASLHAAVMLCTKRFQRCALTMRVAHFCRMKEEQMVQLSEAILAVCVGSRCTDLLLEGSGMSLEDSEGLGSDEGEHDRGRHDLSASPASHGRRSSHLGKRARSRSRSA